MKNKKYLFINIFMIFLLFLLFSACNDTSVLDNGNKDYIFDDESPDILGLNFTRLVPVPRSGALIPVTIDEQVRYTTSIRWQYSVDGENYYNIPVATAFGTDFYQATLTLRVKSGYSFENVPADSYTHRYAKVTHPKGTTSINLTVVIRFPTTPALTDVSITNINLGSLINTPNRGDSPVGSYSFPQFDAAAVWKAGSAVLQPANVFLPATAYSVELALSAKTGYTLFDSTTDTFSHAGAKTIAYDPLTFKLILTFDPTASSGADNPVNQYNFSGLVPAPAHYGPPVENFTGDQYNGTIKWYYDDDPLMQIDQPFEYGRPINAVITLSVKSGYTFTGVPENAFFHSSAVSASYVSGSGLLYVSFPGAKWVLNTDMVTNVPLSGGEANPGINIKACCFYYSATAVLNRQPANLLESSSNYWTNADAILGSTSVLSSNYSSPGWYDFMNNERGAKLSVTESRRGHHSVFCEPNVPLGIRKRTHCITLDLGNVTAGIVQLGMLRQSDDASNWPTRIEFFYSNKDLGPVFNPNDPEIYSLGLFTSTMPSDNLTWSDFNLYDRTEDSVPFSARFIHFRMYCPNPANDMGDPLLDDMRYRLSQIRVVVSE